MFFQKRTVEQLFVFKWFSLIHFIGYLAIRQRLYATNKTSCCKTSYSMYIFSACDDDIPTTHEHIHCIALTYIELHSKRGVKLCHSSSSVEYDLVHQLSPQDVDRYYCCNKCIVPYSALPVCWAHLYQRGGLSSPAIKFVSALLSASLFIQLISLYTQQ